jgi:hypothetical protein
MGSGLLEGISWSLCARWPGFSAEVFRILSCMPGLLSSRSEKGEDSKIVAYRIPHTHTNRHVGTDQGKLKPFIREGLFSCREAQQSGILPGIPCISLMGSGVLRLNTIDSLSSSNLKFCSIVPIGQSKAF